MTYREAAEFYASFGNVSINPDDLMRDWPTAAQLRKATEHAVNVKGRNRAEAEEAYAAIAAEGLIDPVSGDEAV
jgi:hypothetical protein